MKETLMKAGRKESLMTWPSYNSMRSIKDRDPLTLRKEEQIKSRPYTRNEVS